MQENDIIEVLYGHFQIERDWACFHHLRLGTGWVSEQTMDFWAMALLPSMKFETIGFEIKVSRSDFLSEMRNPDKRIMAMTLCDRFIFAAPKGLIKVDELPNGCGLWEIEDGKVLKTRTRYEKNPAKLVCPSWPFIASILRRQARCDWRLREGRGLEIDQDVLPLEVKEA